MKRGRKAWSCRYTNVQIAKRNIRSNQRASVHTEYNYRKKGPCITLSPLDNTYFLYPLEIGFNATKIQFATEYSVVKGVYIIAGSFLCRKMEYKVTFSKFGYTPCYREDKTYLIRRIVTMRRGILKKVIFMAAVVILILGVLLTGCKNNKGIEKKGESKTLVEANSLNGKILMLGSTSMDKLSNALAESFMADYPNTTIYVEFVGSGAGIEAVNAGTADIGNSSRTLKAEEKASGAVENIVALDGIAIIVDSANPVDNLSVEQLQEIYLGNTNNWRSVGGVSQPIVVIGRESASGTRNAFEELLKIEDTCAYSNELDSTGAVMAKVSSIPGAIAYVSLDVVNDTVKVVAIEGVLPMEETIKEGSYPLCRPFVMATKGSISEQNEVTQALFAYLYSGKGTELIKSVGLIPLD